MPVFRVEWTKRISVYVEAASMDECEAAAEVEGHGNYQLEDYADFSNDWSAYVKYSPAYSSKADNGIFKGKMMALEDAQREWHNEKCRQVPNIKCPVCNHRADGEDVNDFVVKDGEFSCIQFLCPECGTVLDTEAILIGEYTEGVFAPCDKTLPIVWDK